MDDRSKRKGWTFRTSRRFWMREDLSMGAKALAHLLLSYADSDGKAFPTSPQLAKASGWSENTVLRYLEELKGAGVTWSNWRDEQGRNRRTFDLSAIHIPPWDGLGGKKKDGRRTLEFRHEPTHQF